MQPVYLYLRWSSDDQTSGNSLERQRTALETYAKKNGFSISDSHTYLDAGVSGFREKNLRGGRLGKFIEGIESGKLRPAPLLIENLDRLSRSGIRKTLSIIWRLNEYGVDVHVVDSSRIYRHGDDDLGGEIMGAVEGYGNKAKSKRSKDFSNAWWAAQENLKPGEAPNSQLPAWITAPRRVKHGPPQKMSVIPDRVRLIKRIFKFSLKGMGVYKIAVVLNQEGIPHWFGKSTWSSEYIDRLLRDRRLLGEHQRTTLDENGKRIQAELLTNYYPPVIDSGLFARVQEIRKATWKSHCGAAGSTKGKAHKESANIFAGLVYDADTGSPYTLRSDRKRLKSGAWKSYPKLICHLSKGEYRTLHFTPFRDEVLNALLAENWEEVFSVTSSVDLSKQIEEAEAALEAARSQREFFIAARKDRSSTESERALIVRDYLAAAKAQTAAEAALTALKARSNQADYSSEINLIVPTLSELKARIAEIVKRITINSKRELIGIEEDGSDIMGYRVRVEYQRDAGLINLELED